MKPSELQEIWKESKLEVADLAKPEDVLSFQNRTNLVLPDDLQDYFKEINGTNQEYDHNFFKFYSLTGFKSVKDELSEWGGLPDYRNIVNTMAFHSGCYVFSDYTCHLLTYCIRLYEEKSSHNEVYIIAGDQFKLIANSFSAFLKIYSENSEILYFSD